MNQQNHWDTIYISKQFEAVSWYQENPETSIQFFQSCQCKPEDGVIDIGAGESYFTDFLWRQGYRNLSVLDISQTAIEKMQKRHESAVVQAEYFACDVLTFIPAKKYRVWHDRACFHFLTDPEQVVKYVLISRSAIDSGGSLIVSTFAFDGPIACSGLNVNRYAAAEIEELFHPYFNLEESKYVDHTTPSGQVQRFLYARLRRTQIVS